MTSSIATPLKGLRLGKLSGYFFDRLDADVERVVLDTIDRLQQRGAAVVDVSIPHADDMAAIYLHLVFGDAAEYHARTLVSRAAGLHDAGSAAGSRWRATCSPRITSARCAARP